MSQGSLLEWQMLDLINAERAAYGLEDLRLEQRLNDAAEDHSIWMIEADSFSHTGQGGSSPTDRMRDAGFELSGSWRTAENVAWQSERGAAGLEDDVVQLHQSLMNSAGHRANILHPDLDYVGIGIERGDYQGWDGVFVTQNFAATAASVQLDTQPGGTSPGSETPAADPAPEPEPEPAVPADGGMEIGQVSVSQSSEDQWHSVSFDRAIADAVVVMGPVSDNGGDPVTVRVQNVTSGGFEFRMEEWDYLDGRHTTETVAWMAVSAGTHEMADGRTIVAGSTEADHTDTRVDMGAGFDDTPLVFAQVASPRGSDAVTTRLKNVDADSFDIRLQEEEANGDHKPERIDWIAVEDGASGGMDAYLVDGVTHQSTGVDLAAGDAIFGQMQSFRGSDTANVRYDADGGLARIWIDEETSADAETKHTGEAVGVLIADLGVYDVFA